MAASVSSPDTLPTDTPSSGRDSLDIDPNSEYVRIKLKLHMKKAGINVEDLQKRLRKLKEHYFFNEKDAEAEFRSERARTEKAALQARLLAPTDPTPKRKPAPSQGAPTEKKPVDILDAADDDSEGGFFGQMLDEMPSAETSNTGVVIKLHDMPLPKHWAGRSPKALLGEIVNKVDRYAAVAFHVVGGASRAARAGVTVRWEGGKVQTWDMSDAGCYDPGQAEQYIATVALHALTFADLPGFASASVTGSSQTYYRLLPPIFRDLWQELEARRKKDEEARNRQIWAKLKSLVDLKLGVPKVSAITQYHNFYSQQRSRSKAKSLSLPATLPRRRPFLLCLWIGVKGRNRL